MQQNIIIILLVVIIVQLAVIQVKLPHQKRDYIAEALERDRIRRENLEK